MVMALLHVAQLQVLKEQELLFLTHQTLATYLMNMKYWLVVLLFQITVFLLVLQMYQ